MLASCPLKTLSGDSLVEIEGMTCCVCGSASLVAFEAGADDVRVNLANEQSDKGMLVQRGTQVKAYCGDCWQKSWVKP